MIDETERIKIELQETRDLALRLEAELGGLLQQTLKPYLDSLLGASGLTTFQAKTILYYAILCHRLDDFDIIPLLTLFGQTGTGKSEAMKQFRRILGMPDDAKVVASTYSDLAKGLNNISVAIIEEADDLRPPERCEELLQKRIDRNQRKQVVHIPPTQKAVEFNNFGATIIHKRGGYNDMATRNRTIMIKTAQRTGDWKLTAVDSGLFEQIAKAVTIEESYLKQDIFKGSKVSQRILDIWKPILEIACYDIEYLTEARSMLEVETMITVADDEPLNIAGKALLSAYWTGGEDGQYDFGHNKKIKDVTAACESNLGISKTTQWLKSNIKELGFTVKFYMGYDWVKADAILSEELRERLEQ